MRRIIAFLTLILVVACSDGGGRYKNPYLPNYGFTRNINLNLPTYSGLNSIINPQVIPDDGSGVTLIVMKVSEGNYLAWDALCPNQYPSACSIMDNNGSNALCSCDNYEYSLFTGQSPDGEYTMKPYRVQVVEPKLIRISN